MIEKALFWNIRSVRSHKALDRLIDLNKRHRYKYIALMEPFQGPHELEQYKRRLGFQNAFCNCSAKIWIFWDEDWTWEVVRDNVQHLSVRFEAGSVKFMVTAVYARCDALERLELWEELEGLAKQNQYPWLVGGDFNVILNEEEKQGGREFSIYEAMDFQQCMNICALSEVRALGSKFTWWNGRVEGNCIFKRLDRVLCNQEFEQIFPSSKVQHLIRQGSDHAPLHLTCKSEEESIIRPFKFLNFWTKHPKFKTIVEENWKVDFKGSPFLEFQAKVKKVKQALTCWSKETFGDIFQQVQRLEEEIRMKEMQLEINP